MCVTSECGLRLVALPSADLDYVGIGVGAVVGRAEPLRLIQADIVTGRRRPLRSQVQRCGVAGDHTRVDDHRGCEQTQVRVVPRREGPVRRIERAIYQLGDLHNDPSGVLVDLPAQHCCLRQCGLQRLGKCGVPPGEGCGRLLIRRFRRFGAGRLRGHRYILPEGLPRVSPLLNCPVRVARRT